MSYEIYLVHCDVRKSVSHRLVVAVGLVRRFGRVLSAFTYEMPVFFEGSLAMDGFPKLTTKT